MLTPVDNIIANTIKHEGGYVNHPSDKGGPTNMGITLATYRLVFPDATIDDLKKLTQSEAAAIYNALYYSKTKTNKLPPFIQDIVFDMNVLHGPINSTTILQRAIKACGGDIIVDGQLGPKTIGAANVIDIKRLRSALIEQRKFFIARIIARDPSQSVFELGWMRRVKWFETNVPSLQS